MEISSYVQESQSYNTTIDILSLCAIVSLIVGIIILLVTVSSRKEKKPGMAVGSVLIGVFAFCMVSTFLLPSPNGKFSNALEQYLQDQYGLSATSDVTKVAKGVLKGKTEEPLLVYSENTGTLIEIKYAIIGDTLKFFESENMEPIAQEIEPSAESVEQ